MSTSRTFADVAIGDYVTIKNAYGRQVRGRVVVVHRDHCTIVSGENQVAIRADASNTVHVSHTSQTTRK